MTTSITNNTNGIMISGGGTGGHVYPALAIADAYRKLFPDQYIQFVGAIGKMEMEKVPLAGYSITGIPISGFQRSNMLKNITLPFKILKSLLKVNFLLKKYKPKAVIGVGGYASGPLLYVAAQKRIPIILQEQNSYPGITNKLLSKKANAICVAYPGMSAYFPADKIIFTGNPVRNFKEITASAKAEAIKYFNLDANRTTILVIGGSLGARTLNESIQSNLSKLASNPEIQVIWQTGKIYFSAINDSFKKGSYPNIHIMPFIERMDLAYAAADVVVSRAGAISISELALMRKATILIPSPNVAEDHQTKNAMALVSEKAALLVKDSEARENLVIQMLDLTLNQGLREQLSHNIGNFAKPDAAYDIAQIISKIALK
jgi:UDP-N-acetylglucosamine--N-acetylmuramyl-(pentapeptide) pyrophosphoryl-undecaprenol N-acetylglucosamine transferase